MVIPHWRPWFALVLLTAIAFLGGGLIRSGQRAYSEQLAAAGVKTETIYLVNNGWHQELALPRSGCPFSARWDALSGAPAGLDGYYVIGWGDRDFFTTTPYLRLMTFRKTVNALLWPSESVLKVRFVLNSPAGWESVREVEVTEEMLRGLYDFAYGEIKLTEGEMVPLPAEAVHPAYGPSLFFPGRSRYTAIYNCNNWTGRALRRSGVPSGLWTPWTWGVGPGN